MAPEPIPDERHPLDALINVECGHTRHQSMCLQCAADAMRPEVERLRAEWDRLNDMRVDEKNRAYCAEAERDRLAEQIKGLREAAEVAAWALATSADDWGETRGKAYIYGIFCGWGCEEAHEHDDICGGDGAMEGLAAQHGWTPEAVDRIRALRRTVRALEGAEAEQ